MLSWSLPFCWSWILLAPALDISAVRLGSASRHASMLSIRWLCNLNMRGILVVISSVLESIFSPECDQAFSHHAGGLAAAFLHRVGLHTLGPDEILVHVRDVVEGVAKVALVAVAATNVAAHEIPLLAGPFAHRPRSCWALGLLLRHNPQWLCLYPNPVKSCAFCSSLSGSPATFCNEPGGVAIVLAELPRELDEAGSVLSAEAAVEEEDVRYQQREAVDVCVSGRDAEVEHARDKGGPLVPRGPELSASSNALAGPSSPQVLPGGISSLKTSRTVG